jgi:hypothetical protein
MIKAHKDTYRTQVFQNEEDEEVETGFRVDNDKEDEDGECEVCDRNGHTAKKCKLHKTTVINAYGATLGAYQDSNYEGSI